jgi:hypothetical protein
VDGWWPVFLALLTAVAVSVAGVVYTTHAQREADQRWCELMRTIDQPYPPPTTERARQAQEQIHRLRVQLGCGR